MINFKKDLNKRVVALLIWLLFFFNNIALYAVELSKNTTLRVPLGKINKKRKNEAVFLVANSLWNRYDITTSMSKLFEMKLDKMRGDDIGKCLRSLGLDTQNSKRFKNMIVKKLDRLQRKRPETRDIIREKALELLEIDENNFKEAFMPFIEDYIAIRDAIKKAGIPAYTAKFYNLFDAILMEAQKGRLDIRRVIDNTYGANYIKYSFHIKGNIVTLRNKGDLLIFRAFETLPPSESASKITHPIWKTEESSYYIYPGNNKKPGSKETIAEKSYMYIVQGLIDNSIIMDIPSAIKALKRFIDFCDEPIISKSKIDVIKTCLDILSRYQENSDQLVMKTELKHVIEAERNPNKTYDSFKRFMSQA